ncbi:MAG TPA: hypothetical protein VGH56_08920 [Solirubrobacteraceae bacterium]
MNSTLRRNRLVAFLAACTLIVCAAVYSAHGLGDRAHEHEHCDLCVHFGGSAASPAQATIIGKPLLVARLPALPASVVLVARSPLGQHLPRGPPPQPTLI